MLCSPLFFSFLLFFRLLLFSVYCYEFCPYFPFRSYTLLFASRFFGFFHSPSSATALSSFAVPSDPIFLPHISLVPTTTIFPSQYLQLCTSTSDELTLTLHPSPPLSSSLRRLILLAPNASGRFRDPSIFVVTAPHHTV